MCFARIVQEMEDLQIVGSSKPCVTGNTMGMEQDGSGDNCNTQPTDSNNAALYTQ